MKICTIGHSNLELDGLIAILRENGISWVADVRSAPYSRRFPQFNRRSLASALNAAGIRYLFLGDKIGGKPPEGTNPELWSQGKLNPMLVSGLSGTPHWREGMATLASAITTLDRDGKTGCILCSEADAGNCHRSLISFELEQTLPGLTVVHIQRGRAPSNVTFQKTLFKVSDDRSDYH